MASDDQHGVLRSLGDLKRLLPQKEPAAPREAPRQAASAQTDTPPAKAKATKRKKGKAPKQKPPRTKRNAAKQKLYELATRMPQHATSRRTTDLLGTPLQSAETTKPASAVSQVPGNTPLDQIDLMAAMPDFLPTTAPTAADVAEISARLDAPRAWFASGNWSGRAPTDIVIGLDVGSTSTKIAFRLPYQGSGAALPVPAPDWLRVDTHPYYWRTILWEGPDGGFALLPTAGAAALQHLKVAVLKAAEENSADPRAERHLAAYVALIIRQGLGWFRISYPRLVADSTFVPSINVGFPAAAMERTNDHMRFSRCCKAGAALGVSDEPVTASTVARYLENTQREPHDDLVEVFPELSGAVAGFVQSSASRDGTYALVDIGGLTLDCVLFNLVSARGPEPRCSVLAASVRRYGAEIARHAIATGLREHDTCEILARSVTKTLVDGFMHKIGAQNVAPDLPLFVIGGGRHSSPHRSAVSRVPRQMRNTHWPLRLQATDLAPPRSGIEVPLLGNRNFGRLLVAAGLSHSRYEIPTWTRSSDVANAAPRMTGRYAERFIGKEMT